MRMDVRRVETIKSGDNFLGSRTKVKVVKNKVAPPFKQAEFDIMYGHGISKEGDILDCAVNENIVDKAGAWYSYETVRIGQGRENVKAYLTEHTEMLEEIEEKLKKKLLGSKEDKEEKNEEEIITDDDGVVLE